MRARCWSWIASKVLTFVVSKKRLLRLRRAFVLCTNHQLLLHDMY